MTIDLRDILINRQTALKCATELVCSGYVTVGESNPADVVEGLADKFEERLLNPDHINRFILHTGAVIDPPLPAPTPITPAAGAPPPPASAAPRSAPTTSAPAPAEEPAKVGPQAEQVAKYAGTKCPYHPGSSRKSTKGIGDFCTAQNCDWGHYFFAEEDGSSSEKWRLNGAYYTAQEFDAMMLAVSP